MVTDRFLINVPLTFNFFVCARREMETGQIPYGEFTAPMKIVGLVAYQTKTLLPTSNCPPALADLMERYSTYSAKGDDLISLPQLCVAFFFFCNKLFE